jgi:anti-anti-sigma regulatory factor
MKAARPRSRKRAPAAKPALRAAAVPVIPAEQPKQRAGLRLEASCTLRDAMDMQFQLLAVDFGESEVLLDGSAVEHIDTAGLQMLVAFAKHYSARGRRVQWTAASPELLRGSHLLGLASVLGLEDMPAGASSGH